MHGVILDELRRFVADRYGYRRWIETLKSSGRPATQGYELDRTYPDGELGLLATHAAQVTGTPLPALLEGFGAAMLPDLMRVYPNLLEPKWSYADFLENMEPLFVEILRLHTPGASQTRIHVRHTAPESIEVVYDSPLRACAAVEGVMKAAAREYRSEAEVVQTRCVLKGAPDCLFTVRLGSSPAAA